MVFIKAGRFYRQMFNGTRESVNTITSTSVINLARQQVLVWSQTSARVSTMRLPHWQVCAVHAAMTPVSRDGLLKSEDCMRYGRSQGSKSLIAQKFANFRLFWKINTLNASTGIKLSRLPDFRKTLSRKFWTDSKNVFIFFKFSTTLKFLIVDRRRLSQFVRTIFIFPVKALFL